MMMMMMMMVFLLLMMVMMTAARTNESKVTITTDSDSQREGCEGRSSENIIMSLDDDENKADDRDEVKTWSIIIL